MSQERSSINSPTQKRVRTLKLHGQEQIPVNQVNQPLPTSTDILTLANPHPPIQIYAQLKKSLQYCMFKVQMGWERYSLPQVASISSRLNPGDISTHRELMTRKLLSTNNSVLNSELDLSPSSLSEEDEKEDVWDELTLGHTTTDLLQKAGANTGNGLDELWAPEFKEDSFFPSPQITVQDEIKDEPPVKSDLSYAQYAVPYPFYGYVDTSPNEAQIARAE